MNTSKDALQGAWAALARGDLHERDRLCERAELLLEAEQRASAISNLLAAGDMASNALWRARKLGFLTKPWNDL